MPENKIEMNFFKKNTENTPLILNSIRKYVM